MKGNGRPALRDADVKWIGQIPSHWKVRHFRYCGVIPNGQVDPKLPQYRDKILVAPNHIESGTGKLLGTETADEQGAESGKYLFRAGDILYSKIRPELAKACLVQFGGLCSADMYPITPSKDMLPGYLGYLLIAPKFTEYVVLASARVAMPKVNRAELGDCPLPVPPVDEQRAILSFLNWKTAQIDALVARKQRQIDLLSEKRQALISHAITKGLDPHAPKKRSGYPWLGCVPKHWEVERLKFRMKRIEQGWSPQCENRQAEAGEWGVLKVGCMNSGVYDESENKALPPGLEPLKEYEVQVGDVLMSRSNTVELVGAVGMVHATQGRILLCDKLYRLELDKNRLLPEYSVHLLRSRAARLQIERDASGASPSMKNISNDRVTNLLLAFPPLDEQRGIVQHIEQELARSRRIEETVQRQIDKLREYRQTLISAAVTGNIDVATENTGE